MFNVTLYQLTELDGFAKERAIKQATELITAELRTKALEDFKEFCTFFIVEPIEGDFEFEEIPYKEGATLINEIADFLFEYGEDFLRDRDVYRLSTQEFLKIYRTNMDKADYLYSVVQDVRDDLQQRTYFHTEDVTRINKYFYIRLPLFNYKGELVGYKDGENLGKF